MDCEDLANELRDYLAGFAGRGAGELDALPRGKWAEVAAAERLRRLASLVQGFSTPLLAALASGRLDGDSVAAALTENAGEPRATLDWRESPSDLKPAVAAIALRELGIQTLEERGRDSLDFRDVGVVGLRGALLAAVELGRGLKR